MDGARIFTCPTCGKTLDGVVLDYSQQWQCSKCFEHDSKQAKELLVEGQVYEVEKINIGGWISAIWLKEFPGKKFNTVHFERCE